MKRGKLTITITIGIMCLILTLVIFIQVKTISQTNITELEIMREDELREEISALKTRTNEVDTKLAETNEKIAEYQEAINKGKKASELLAEELKETEDLLGKTTVTGEGIVIYLESDSKTVKASDLIELINQLRDAGAEAISINDERIVYESYVVYINEDENYIKINTKIIGEPYVIKAIGNTAHLESAVAQKRYGYIDKQISEGKKVTLEKPGTITIAPYNRDLNFEYVKEGE